MRGSMRGLVVVFALGLFGCPEHHRVTPRDAATPDAPADFELCRTTSVRCMTPVSSIGCPETLPLPGVACMPNGLECAYCPGGDYGVAGAQIRSCIGGRWTANREACGSAP